GEKRGPCRGGHRRQRPHAAAPRGAEHPALGRALDAGGAGHPLSHGVVSPGGCCAVQQRPFPAAVYLQGKSFMRFLVRTGILIAQLLVFFALMTLISWGTTYFTAER